MPSNPPPPQRYVRRDDPILSRYGYTARSVRRAQSAGRLSRVKLSGPTGPCLVDLFEVRRMVRAVREPATAGPLAGQGDDLDALARRWAEDRDPEAQAALIAIVQKADSALWEDV